MSKYRYNREIAKRFVSEERLPIPILGEDFFEYHLTLYEDKFKAYTKYMELLSVIDEKFNGSDSEFLDYFYNIRETFITKVKEMEPYITFNTTNMNAFSVEQIKNVRFRELYNEECIGKSFISVDLKKANFQAIKYFDKNNVYGNTYEDLVGKFTDLDYIRNSKYFRQVVFGQLNPSRQQTVEKFLIYKVINHLMTYYGVTTDDIVTIKADEIILFDLPHLKHISNPNDIKSNTWVDVKIERFALNGYNFFSNKENRKRFTFYYKHQMDTLNGIPLQYHAMAFKLFYGMEISEMDYHFNYENIDCRFMDTFRIEKINKK
jgi:hypothetical protein